MKRSITGKIILSYVFIVIVSMIFTGILFGFTALKYLENKAKANLMKNAVEIASIIRSETVTDNDINEKKIMQSIRATLKKNLRISATKLAIISKDFRIIIPEYTEEAITFEEEALPSLKKQLLSGKRGFVKFNMDSTEYMSAVIPVERMWVVLYTPIGQANQLSQGIFMVLLVSMGFTCILAVILGVIIARSIAKPIIKLKEKAELLSKRNFDIKAEIKTGDELEDLGNAFDRMAVELKEYDISQKRFLQNASHELKTPLMSIQGYAEGIKDGVFEDNSRALDIIVEESSRLRNIVDDIIYLSKLETMEDFYWFRKESMNEIITKSVEKVESIALKNNIKIETELSDDVVLVLDRDKITQALINVLGNCLRYARSRVFINSQHYSEWVEIDITDDGEGFKDDETTKIFTRFYKGRKGDTGLGLAITKTIIEKHGGTIEASNSDAGGARFEIRLPVK